MGPVAEIAALVKDSLMHADAALVEAHAQVIAGDIIRAGELREIAGAYTELIGSVTGSRPDDDC